MWRELFAGMDGDELEEARDILEEEGIDVDRVMEGVGKGLGMVGVGRDNEDDHDDDDDDMNGDGKGEDSNSKDTDHTVLERLVRENEVLIAELVFCQEVRSRSSRVVKALPQEDKIGTVSSFTSSPAIFF